MSDHPHRSTWRDFPPSYIDTLRAAAGGDEVRRGPMNWNDARFAQREFYRLVAVLRRNKADDQEAAHLAAIAEKVRVSCPRVDGDPENHWFILRRNPLVGNS